MKKFSLLTTVLLMMLLLASCSKQKSARLIPDDAFVVMRFDVMQTMEKSGLKDDKSDLKKWAKEMISETGMSKAMRDKMLDILGDPTTSGIDFTEPIYIYAKATKAGAEFGVVADMASEGDLTDLLNAIAKEDDSEQVAKTRSGASYLDMGSNGAIIYTDEWFYAGQVRDVDDMVETLLDRAEGKGTIEGNKAFEAMRDKKGVMQLLMLYSGMPSVPEMKEVEKMLPEGLDLADFAALADLELKPGETLFTGEPVALSKEWQDYIDKSLGMAKPLNKELARYISGQGLSAFLNIDMKEMWQYIEQSAKLYGIDDEETLAQVKELVNGFSGTASFQLTDVVDGMPQMALYMGTDDDQLVKLAAENVGGIDSLQQVADSEYVLLHTDMEFDDDMNVTSVQKQLGLVGYRNGQTFFCTDADKAFAEPSTPYPADKLKGRGFYMHFNFDFLKRMKLDDANENMLMALSAVASIFTEAELYYTDDAKGVFRLVGTDSQKTLIETIADLVKGLSN